MITHLQIQNADGFPQTLCLECQGEAVKSYSFRILCESTDRLLQAGIEQPIQLEFQCKFPIKSENIEEYEEQEISDELNDEIYNNTGIKPDSSNLGPDIDSPITSETSDIRLRRVRSYPFDCATGDLEIYDNGRASSFMINSLLPNIGTFGNTVTDDLENHIYRCGHCEFDSYSLMSLIFHNKSHEKSVMKSCKQRKNTKKPQFNCQYSNTRQNSYFSTTENAIKEHTEWFHCSNCGYKGNNKELFKKHISRHILNRLTKAKYRNWFKCAQCDFKTLYQPDLKLHILNTHSTEENAKWLQCKHCYYKAKYESILKLHVLNSHTNEENVKWLKCVQCNYKTKLKGALNLHMIKHEQSENIKWFECAECDYKTRYKSALKLHSANLHADEEDVNWFNCGQCEFQTKYKGALKRHISNRHTH